jgi:FtsP/CotA-like multicopper oxidase with cupredoxin domain
MGMDHDMSGGGMDHDPVTDADHSGDPDAHAGHEPIRTPEADPHAGHAMGAMGGAAAEAMRPPGTLPEPTMHSDDEHGPGNASVPMETRSRLHEPGLGTGDDGWRVLTYTQVRALEPYPDLGMPDREIELHLTGNMERFMWSIDGIEFSDSEPIHVDFGERIRLTMVSDTMMNHPMHLHGMWMHLENGHGELMPRVHTINVKPAERLSLLFNADAPGPWAFHCHVLYHMEAGMFRVFHVGEPGDDAPAGMQHQHEHHHPREDAHPREDGGES